MSTCCLRHGDTGCQRHITGNYLTTLKKGYGRMLSSIQLADAAEYGNEELRRLANEELRKRRLPEYTKGVAVSLERDDTDNLVEVSSERRIELGLEP